MKRWHWAGAASVRALIAAHMLREQEVPSRLGEIVLHDHQRDAAARLRDGLARFGGALLADEVGLGKTYTALAAASDAGSVLVVAPAALAAMWRAALERTGIVADVTSFETLSRGEAPVARYDLVIIDEAHHARNPKTKRYDRLASLTWRSHVLLLSATPLHNTAGDLHALLGLFLGSRAERMTTADLDVCIVRRTRHDVPDSATPHRAKPKWLAIHTPSDVLDALLAIPPPCAPRDGGDGGALVTLSLVRAWCSSAAALRAALRRRLVRAEALADALDAGRHPTRAEMRAWVSGDDATQLAFPELVASQPVEHDAHTLITAVRQHAEGVRRILASVTAVASASDDERAESIRGVRQAHTGERIVVFSQFAESVQAIFGRLRGDPRVAAITAHGAWVAGGPLSRQEALARFAPIASGTRPPGPAHVIEVLIATDLLSEGLNLQDASVVVHLDLPWTPARLAQRMGRVWRIGSRHRVVHEYALAPPGSAEAVLGILRRLRAKSVAARTAIGETLLPLLAAATEVPHLLHATADARPSPEDPAGGETVSVSSAEPLRRALASWRARGRPAASTIGEDAGARDRRPGELGGVVRLHLPGDREHAPAHGESPLVSAVRARDSGWLALVVEMASGRRRLIGASGPMPAAAGASAILELVSAAGGPSCAAAPSRIERALAELERFLDCERGAADAGVGLVGSRAHARVANHIAGVVAAAPIHRRAAVSLLAARARAALTATRAAGGERVLDAIAPAAHAPESPASDSAWLDRVIDLGSQPSPRSANASGARAEAATVLALLVLVGSEASRGETGRAVPSRGPRHDHLPPTRDASRADGRSARKPP